MDRKGYRSVALPGWECPQRLGFDGGDWMPPRPLAGALSGGARNAFVRADFVITQGHDGDPRLPRQA